MTCPAKTSWSSVKRFAAARRCVHSRRSGTALSTPCARWPSPGSSAATGWSPPWCPARRAGTNPRCDASPPASIKRLAPVSWIFQTLAVFFLVGGYSAARGYRGGYLTWLRQRLGRLGRPVGVLLAVWAPVTAALWIAGVPLGIIHTLLTLVVDPLWFLGVYAVLTALTPAAMCIASRFGARAALLPAGEWWPPSTWRGSLCTARAGSAGSTWPAGWFVPYLFGVAWALGKLHGRRGPALMLAGGAAATAALIAWAGYPASMVGVNGAHISNLNPPTLAAVTLRDRPVRPGAAAARPAGAADAPPAGLGRDRAGQPVGDDAVPLAPDRVRRGQLRSACWLAGCRAC